MSPLRLLLILNLSLACSDKQEEQVTPIFDTSPSPCQAPEGEIRRCGLFLFSPLKAGQQAQRELDLLNRGKGDLVIKDLRLEDESTAGEFKLFIKGTEGEHLELPELLELPGGEEYRLTLLLIYRPEDDSSEPDTGVLRFRSNDPQSLEVEIPILTGGRGAEIRVVPNALNFGPVEAGEEAERELQISNSGVVNLQIDGFNISGSPDFSLFYEGEVLSSERSLNIPSGENLNVQLRYAPPAAGPDEGELQILSNDGTQRMTTVPLSANGAEACLRLLPQLLEFPSALRVDDPEGPTPNRQALSFQSCGQSVLRVERLEFDQEVFGLIEDPLPLELPAAFGTEFPTQQLVVGFWPLELGSVGGRMQVYSNASGSPHSVDLFGRGVDNACPFPAVVVDRFDVAPLDQLLLDGSPSFDPGGEVRRWEWSVLSRPDGSVSQIFEGFEDPRRPADGGTPDDPETPEAVFFVDLAGHYEIELRVIDNLGQMSCAPESTLISIDAVPEKDLHLQLVWSTPADPDETDLFGTDVDLHLRHQSGGDSWGERAGGWDCYFANTGPDWGVQGDVADNPSLDIDDRNGAGPENINLARPEPGVTYDIGVLYFKSESSFNQPDADPRIEHLSYATLRLYIHGELMLEFVDRELTQVNQLWWVAGLEWCEDLLRCPIIHPHDQILQDLMAP